MPWIKEDEYSKFYSLVIRSRRLLRVIDFKTKDAAMAYLDLRRELKRQQMERIDAENQIDQNLDRLSQLVDQIVEESLICQGMVRRKGVYQLVSRLNHPLTNEEKANIRRVKFKAKPRSFEELKGRQSEIETPAASIATKESLRG